MSKIFLKYAKPFLILANFMMTSSNECKGGSCMMPSTNKFFSADEASWLPSAVAFIAAMLCRCRSLAVLEKPERVDG